MNELLANIISLFHILIILFVILAPFSGSIYLLIIHIFFCISLFVHWYANNNSCSLSIIESRLRGLDHTESISHRIIAPIYDISKSDMNTLVWITTFVLFGISIYNCVVLLNSTDLRNLVIL